MEDDEKPWNSKTIYNENTRFMKKEGTKEGTKKVEKWKPKRRWIKSFRINLKTGETKYNYFTPKTLEEEKQLEADWDAKMEYVFNILFPEGLK